VRAVSLAGAALPRQIPYIHILETGLAETRIILSYANHRGEKGRERETITIASPFFARPPPDKIRLLGFTTLHDTRRDAIPQCLGPSPHTQTQRHGVHLI
jgi:hypothetical protein